jgi:hypothetical protein
MSAALFEPETYWEMCDASAGVALDDSHFAVADDEGNVLRIYKRGQPNPVGEHNFTKFLAAKGGETDLEGCARVGNCIYWISSHGRDKEGKPAPNRKRFFATEIAGPDGLKLEPVGAPDKDLLADLISDPKFARFGFAAASLKSPKQAGGLNIEGMCARPDGSLLIGFRNPIPGKMGLLVPLLNPDKVVQGEKAQFGEIIELDLAGGGIRDICPTGDGRYIIIVGTRDGTKDFRLNVWDGVGTKTQEISGHFFNKLNPEAIFRFEKDAPGVFQVLSDDGSKRTGDVRCKDLKKNERHFRAGEVRLSLPK